ncbi:hypothetical protein DVT68_00445 [Dyella solisilvae]|uniref:Uncharacterized protein n=1 Tax=Dyella solisilvae TaxID=1920168 RepID=A0A370K9N8_9GAMM|nr:hypothetical protein [Dyella solisilvae]RDI99368.1 hypothetical protein DVT68_00445 [Dyella solisilvae]
MSTRLHAAIALAAIGLTAAVTPKAEACGYGDGQSWSSTHWSLPPAALKSLASQAAAASPQVVANSTNPLQALEPITGLYMFTFTAKGNKTIPDGVQLDQGFATWHADGTEIMNSGKPPITQSFCMGVWEQSGARAYKLNHWAINWDSTGTVFLGLVNIQESIKLDATGNTYSGNLTITPYPPSGSPAGPSVLGVVTATRVQVNSN